MYVTINEKPVPNIVETVFSQKSTLPGANQFMVIKTEEKNVVNQGTTLSMNISRSEVCQESIKMVMDIVPETIRHKTYVEVIRYAYTFVLDKYSQS
ncbi:hypothetical protein Q1695_000699 [Nippostrongylus brasiliensis]|nr:hypothetical protein Q1695_000699 [Nippostrongylus brasiliensis]